MQPEQNMTWDPERSNVGRLKIAMYGERTGCITSALCLCMSEGGPPSIAIVGVPTFPANSGEFVAIIMAGRQTQSYFRRESLENILPSA
jgi:hypothetical protein